MKSRNADMQAIFLELSEKNKDVVILIAQSVKAEQKIPDQLRRSTHISKTKQRERVS